MNGSVDKIATQLLADYERLVSGGDDFSGVVALGELVSFLSQVDPVDQHVHRWKQRLDEIIVDPMVFDRAHERANAQIKRMLRIMGSGGRFEYEEVMLLITLRVELELFSDAVHFYGYTPTIDPSLADEELAELAQSRENAAAFHSAKKAAMKNSVVPIVWKSLETLGKRLN